MRHPTLAAVVERRLLINHRADPEVVAPLLPARLRPQLVDGAAVIGVCFMRLSRLRPLGWPPALGLRTESAAHRIAVEWDGDDGLRSGVYIPRRDSNARISVAAGGRLFPGVHHHADFRVAESAESFQVSFVARDGSARAAVEATVATSLGGHLFSGVHQASAFFQAGSVGFSPSRAGGALEGIELCTDRWAVEPVTVRHAASSFFSDRERFPAGSVELDCGLVMRQVPVLWVPTGPLDGMESAEATPATARMSGAAPC